MKNKVLFSISRNGGLSFLDWSVELTDTSFIDEMFDIENDTDMGNHDMGIYMGTVSYIDGYWELNNEVKLVKRINQYIRDDVTKIKSLIQSLETSELKSIKNLGQYSVNGVLPLSIAKQLKSMGYDKESFYYYLDRDDIPLVEGGLKMGERKINHNTYDGFIYTAPTKQEALDWINSCGD